MENSFGDMILECEDKWNGAHKLVLRNSKCSAIL